jgi:hypothetical protein
VALTQQGWQRLLDLLEERTGVAYDDLWSEWVLNDAEQALLAERAETRALYFEGVAAAGDWELPELIRYDLSSWQFEDVVAELELADQVLAKADAIADLAVDLDLTPPDELQAAFEGNDGLESALDEGDSELTAVQDIREATNALATDPGFVAWVGLLFSDPRLELATARDAWEEGDSEAAASGAGSVMVTLDEADDRGAERLAASGGVLLVVGSGAAFVWRRRGRRGPPTDSAGEDQVPGDEAQAAGEAPAPEDQASDPEDQAG